MKFKKVAFLGKRVCWLVASLGGNLVMETSGAGLPSDQCTLGLSNIIQAESQKVVK